MKKIFRVVTLLLTLCLLLGSLSSCATVFRLFGSKDPQETLSPVPSQPLPGDTAGQVPTDQLPQDLQYDLTQADVDAFAVLLQELEAHFSGNEVVGDEQKRMEDLEAAYEHLATQEQLAYIYYCVDQLDESASERYLFASAAVSDSYKSYMEMCARLREADTALTQIFFADWTEEDFAALDSYDPQMNELQKRNDALLVEYRALSDGEMYAKTPALYLQMLQTNNSIASLNGYESYWDYAYAEVYGREYDSAFLNQMRQNVRAYLLPLMEQTLLRLQLEFSVLTPEKQRMVQSILYRDYDDTAADLIMGYTNSYEAAVAKLLQEPMQPQNAFFTDSENSYAGAFTAYLYESERPICYFGPGYQSAFTVVHEMGHYYAAGSYGSLELPLDLAEVHSQGNEWLFCRYLSQALPQDVVSVIRLNQLYSSFTTIVCAMVVDEFEQLCYAALPANAAALEEAMRTVMENYGGEQWLKSYVADMQAYWRYVVLESPVYYISYAVSGLTALQLMTVFPSDDAAAQGCFLALCEEKNIDLGFLECLTAVGLMLPNDARLIESIELFLSDR